MNNDINKKIAKDVLSETEKIINLYGPRLAGTKSSLDAANYLYEDGKKYSDSMHIESFNIHKGAFFGWIKILVLNYMFSLLAIIFNYPVVALILSVLSVVILYVQFIRYLPMIDFLFPKKKASNVYGIIEPKGEVKKQIIISGHHDSAPIFNFFVHQPKLYALRINGGIGFVIFSLISGILLMFLKSDILKYSLVGLLGLGALIVCQMWFFANKKGTPGAGDNLASTEIAFQIGKYFYNKRNSNEELKHTRIIFASFDAEEEGLRGARAFVKKHKAMLKDIDTEVLNIECLYDDEVLFFLTSDINNSVKLSKDLANDLVKVSDTLNIKTYTENIKLLTGGTDAGEFGKIGVKATTIFGMPWTNSNRSTSYHTPNDTIDSVSEKAVYNTLSIFINYIKKTDSNL